MPEVSEMDWISRRGELPAKDLLPAAIAYLRRHAYQVGYDGGSDHFQAIVELLLTRQPIETAPKDGTTLILYCDHPAYSSDVADIGHWEGEEWSLQASGWEPTHWSPLLKA